MSAAAQYLALTKPRLLWLVLCSGLPALLMATGGWPAPAGVAQILAGTLLAAGAANALNSYVERDRDARMERTRSRPLPAGRLDPGSALVFALLLTVLGTGSLWLTSGPLAAGIALGSILYYIFVYTLWLKPRTAFAVVAGGVTGAIAPLIADAAVDGQLGATGWMLFAIIFVWQPPHFYAIALYRRSEYAQAGFPMLHDRIGEEATRTRILLWILALIPVSLLPVGLGTLGLPYAAVATALGLWLLWTALQLRRQRDAAAARQLFRVSLYYLTGVFAAMLADLSLRL